jgi:hypothetical protein
MDDTGLLGRIWSFLSVQLAAWAIFCLNVVAWLKVRNERLRDISTEKANDWDRVRAERDRYHELLVKCQRERNEYMARAVKAEATLDGLGEARQEAQRIVSAEREKQRGNGGDNA